MGYQTPAPSGEVSPNHPELQGNRDLGRGYTTGKSSNNSARLILSIQLSYPVWLSGRCPDVYQRRSQRAPRTSKIPGHYLECYREKFEQSHPSSQAVALFVDAAKVFYVEG